MTVADAQLLDVAEQIGPTLRQAADEGEQHRRFPRASLEALKGAGLHRMLLPKSLGGLEVDIVTCARVTEEITR